MSAPEAQCGFMPEDCCSSKKTPPSSTIVFDEAATKCDEIALNSTKGKFMLVSPLKAEPLYQGIRARVQSQASASDLLERIRQKAR